MKTNRLEAFSDGVIAIILTIMVLELKIPHEATFEALKPLLPKFLAYLLSFIYVGIFWNNHHHLFQVSDRVSGGVLWANLHLLFWMSLIPFATDWAGETHFESAPTAMYGIIFLLSAIAYTILVRALLKVHGPTTTLARAIGSDRKGLTSIAICAMAIPLSFYRAWVGFSLYVVVELIWLIPDRRIELALKRDGAPVADPKLEEARGAPLS